jgi:hypothetical protein
MFHLGIAFLRLYRAFKAGFKDPEFKALTIFVIGLLTTGTIFYTQIEHWRVLDAIYFSITTLTTVGFGDLTPKTDLGKIFTIFYIITGVGTFLSYITLIAQHAKDQDPLLKRLTSLTSLLEKEEKKELPK